MALLNKSNLEVDFTVTSGGSGVIAASGPFGGAEVDLLFSLPSTPTEFEPIESGNFTQGFAKSVIFNPGTKIKARLNGVDRGGVSSQVHIEYTASA